MLSLKIFFRYCLQSIFKQLAEKNLDQKQLFKPILDKFQHVYQKLLFYKQTKNMGKIQVFL